MLRLAYIVIFGIVGVLGRYYMGMAVTRSYPSHFPLGTFLINILGSFLIGMIYVLGAEKPLISEDLRIGISVGLLGGFTTFSAYALESVRMVEQSQALIAAVYFVGSPIVGFIAALGGLWIARALT